ncbi:MAG: carbon monoxide dehydrogenase accessory protein CooC [Chloroflexota bacterium]
MRKVDSTTTVDAGSSQLRIAFLGKGGVGKSTIAGTVCRYLARDGRRVLALDMDTVPGLAFSLGIPVDMGRLPSNLAEIVEGKKGRRWKIVKGAGAASLVDRYAVRAIDGIRFLELGKLPHGVEPSVTVAFRHVIERFRRPGWAVVADLAAGTRQPMFGWAEFATIRVLVVEPSAKSILTARRLVPVATHVVASKVRNTSELKMVTEATSLPLIGAIPYDERMGHAEQLGDTPIDGAPDSPSVKAIAELTRQLQELV